MNTTSPVSSLSGDELVSSVHTKPDIFTIEPEMPLYDDLSEMHERKSSHCLVFYTHEEVWDT
jgi:hypothetical protein